MNDPTNPTQQELYDAFEWLREKSLMSVDIDIGYTKENRHASIMLFEVERLNIEVMKVNDNMKGVTAMMIER